MRRRGPTPDEVAADAEAPAHVARGDADRGEPDVDIRPPQGALPLGGGDDDGDDDFGGEALGGHAPAPSFDGVLRAPAPPGRAAPAAPPGTRFFESAGELGALGPGPPQAASAAEAPGPALAGKLGGLEAAGLERLQRNDI
jgi:hypothetical protein